MSDVLDEYTRQVTLQGADVSDVLDEYTRQVTLQGADVSDVLDEYTRQVTLQGAALLEERIRLVLRPRPWWLPERMWRMVVRRLIVIEHRDAAGVREP